MKIYLPVYSSVEADKYHKPKRQQVTCLPLLRRAEILTMIEGITLCDPITNFQSVIAVDNVMFH